MESFDIAVIGSGASGSVVAWQMVNRGARVVLIEKGSREQPETFSHNEFEMAPRLYKSGGLQTTADNNVAILQGSTLGGSTVINNAIWLRADLDRVLRDWELRGAWVSRAEIEEGYDEFERLLKVVPVSADLPQGAANAGTNVFLNACRALNLKARRLYNNRTDCLGCGWCNYGCRYNRKTSTLVTLIPWAEHKGLQVIDRCSDVRLIAKGDRVVRVECHHDSNPLTVKADRFVVCAGAIGSTEVLLRSGIKQNGRVGQGFHLLGGVVLNALMPDAVNGFDGIGLTAMTDTGADHIIETFFSPPGTFAVTTAGWLEGHADQMKLFANYLQAGVMVGTAPHGIVSLKRDGNCRIDFRFSRKELAALKRGIRQAAQIFLAAGALSISPSTYQPLAFKNEGDLDQLDPAIQNASDLLLGSAHPQGGNTMSEDPKGGVVGLDFRLHGFRNVFVADASVFPSNIWANCQATVMAMAHYASKFIAA